jgi:hypothetical protein
MKKSKFSESQIVNILKEAEVGVSVEELSLLLQVESQVWRDESE